MTVYASPTSEGVATVACLAPPADAAAFKAECEAIADTLQLASGKPFPVGPDPGYAKTLGATLAQARRPGRERPQGAGARRRDVQGAGRRRARDPDAYAAAAKTLRDTQTSPADTLINDALVDRLRAASARMEAGGRGGGEEAQGRASPGRAAAIKQTQAELARAVARARGRRLQALEVIRAGVKNFTEAARQG